MVIVRQLSIRNPKSITERTVSPENLGIKSSTGNMGRFDDGGGFATLIPHKLREIEACPYSNPILSAEQKGNLGQSPTTENPLRWRLVDLPR